METMTMSTLDVPHAVCAVEEDTNKEEKQSARLTPRIAAALGVLLEALEYAEDARETNAWDFAVEIDCLRELKLTNSDMRWLVARGLVDHALEVTLAGDAERSFRHPARVTLGRKTCFMLTPGGAALARDAAERIATTTTVSAAESQLARTSTRSAREATNVNFASAEPIVPKWDHQRQELRVGPVVVKRFTIPSREQEMVLAAFEAEGWPARIETPLLAELAAGGAQLATAVEALNRRQRRPLVSFSRAPDGSGACWQFCSEAATQ